MALLVLICLFVLVAVVVVALKLIELVELQRQAISVRARQSIRDVEMETIREMLRVAAQEQTDSSGR